MRGIRFAPKCVLFIRGIGPTEMIQFKNPFSIVLDELKSVTTYSAVVSVAEYARLLIA